MDDWMLECTRAGLTEAAARSFSRPARNSTDPAQDWTAREVHRGSGDLTQSRPAAKYAGMASSRDSMAGRTRRRLSAPRTTSSKMESIAELQCSWGLVRHLPRSLWKSKSVRSRDISPRRSNHESPWKAPSGRSSTCRRVFSSSLIWVRWIAGEFSPRRESYFRKPSLLPCSGKSSQVVSSQAVQMEWNAEWIDFWVGCSIEIVFTIQIGNPPCPVDAIGLFFTGRIV